MKKNLLPLSICFSCSAVLCMGPQAKVETISSMQKQPAISTAKVEAPSGQKGAKPTSAEEKMSPTKIVTMVLSQASPESTSALMKIFFGVLAQATPESQAALMQALTPIISQAAPEVQTAIMQSLMSMMPQPGKKEPAATDAQKAPAAEGAAKTEVAATKPGAPSPLQSIMTMLKQSSPESQQALLKALMAILSQAKPDAQKAMLMTMIPILEKATPETQAVIIQTIAGGKEQAELLKVMTEAAITPYDQPLKIPQGDAVKLAYAMAQQAGKDLKPAADPVTSLRETVNQVAVLQKLRKLKTTGLQNWAQRKAPINYAFSGYIKTDAFFDSYQSLGYRQNHMYLWPMECKPDLCGRNINTKGQFDILAVETRVRADFAGPKVWCAKTYAAVEADFWGGLDLTPDIINLFRLRHAFLYLEWPRTTVLMGQYWHPVFVDGCYPETVSYNTGAPIDVYSLEPQIRITKQFDNVTLLFAAASYANAFIDPNPFAALGVSSPAGLSNLRLRNAVMPDLNFQAHFAIKEHSCGIGLNVRRMVLRLATEGRTGLNTYGTRVTQDLFSFLGFAYAKLRFEKFSLAFKINMNFPNKLFI